MLAIFCFEIVVRIRNAGGRLDFGDLMRSDMES